MADGCAPERAIDGLIRPDQSFFQINLVIGAELCGILPILIIESRPSLQLLAHPGKVEFIHVWNFNLKGDPLLLPLKIGDRRTRTAVVKPVGQEFCGCGVLRRGRDAQRIIFRVVLEASPAQMVGKDPEPGSVLFHVEKQRVCSGLQILTIDLHVIGECDGGAFVCSGAPGRSFGWAKTLIHKTVMDQFTPDVAGAIVLWRVMHPRAVIFDRNPDRPDPLGNFGSFIVPIGRGG